MEQQPGLVDLVVGEVGGLRERVLLVAPRLLVAAFVITRVARQLFVARKQVVPQKVKVHRAWQFHSVAFSTNSPFASTTRVAVAVVVVPAIATASIEHSDPTALAVLVVLALLVPALAVPEPVLAPPVAHQLVAVLEVVAGPAGLVVLGLVVLEPALLELLIDVVVAQELPPAVQPRLVDFAVVAIVVDAVARSLSTTTDAVLVVAKSAVFELVPRIEHVGESLVSSIFELR